MLQILVFRLIQSQFKMQINPTSVLVSQTPNDSKYNLSFNFNLPSSDPLQPTPMLNFQITIPHKPMEEANIQTQANIEPKLKLQPQNKAPNTDGKLETFSENRHMNRPIPAITQNKIKFQEKSPSTAHQRHRERSRTRDQRTNGTASIGPKPHLHSIKRISEKRDLFRRVEESNMFIKQKFYALHHTFTRKFTGFAENQYYLINGYSWQLITNTRPIDYSKKTYIKVAVLDNNCSVGITTFTKNLEIYTKILNRYMTYSFRDNQMNIRQTIYKNDSIQYPKLNVFMCIVDFKDRRFYIINRHGLVRSDVIPEQLLPEHIHFFIELRGKGHIKFL